MGEEPKGGGKIYRECGLPQVEKCNVFTMGLEGTQEQYEALHFQFMFGLALEVGQGEDLVCEWKGG